MKQVGENEAYFKINFSRAYVNHLLRMKCHMKIKTMDIKGYDFDLFQKIAENAQKTHPKL